MRSTLSTRLRSVGLSALLALSVMVPVSLVSAGVANAAAVLPNPGFEILNTKGNPAEIGAPTCWETSGDGVHTQSITVESPGRTGQNAVSITISAYTSGSRSLLMSPQAKCTPAVTPGRTYDLSFWYKSTAAAAKITLYRHDTRAGWVLWDQPSIALPVTRPATTEYVQAIQRTPVIPAGTDLISWGPTLSGLGTFTVDDFAIVDSTGLPVPPPVVVPTATPAAPPAAAPPTTTGAAVPTGTSAPAVPPATTTAAAPATTTAPGATTTTPAAPAPPDPTTTTPPAGPAAALPAGPEAAPLAIAAEPGNLVLNPGFEELGPDGFPECWWPGGGGVNTSAYGTAGTPRTGTKALTITISAYTDGNRVAKQAEIPDCAPAVEVGKQYNLGFWYTSTTPNASVTLYRHDTVTGWEYWQDLGPLSQTAAYAQFTAVTPVIPANTDQISFGGYITAVGTLTEDDFTMSEAGIAPPPPPDPADPTNLVENPSFEAVGPDGFPTCWWPGGGGVNTFAYGTAGTPRTGDKALTITISAYTDGNRVAKQAEIPACAPQVTVGKTYDLGFWYTSTTPAAAVTLYRHDTVTGWEYWQDLGPLAPAAVYTEFAAQTPVIPANTDQIAFGGYITGVGTLTEDDFTLSEVVDEEPPPPVDPTNLITNPGFEAVAADGFPTCWWPGGAGVNTFAYGADGTPRTGDHALTIEISAYTSGNRVAKQAETPDCAPAVTVGKQYQLGLWYTSTTANAAVTLYRHDTVTGWEYWQDLGALPQSAVYQQFTALTPVIPPNTDRIVFGGYLTGVGLLTQDDYTLYDPTVTPEPPVATNMVVNPSFEELGPDGFPTCWGPGGAPVNTFAYTTDGTPRTGDNALKIAISDYTSGNRVAMQGEAPACAPGVQAGKQYQLSFWYTSTTPNAGVTLYKHDAAGWDYWQDLGALTPSATYAQFTALTPEIPAGVDMIRFGGYVYGVGELVQDDYSMIDPAVPPPPAVCSGTTVQCTTGEWQVLAQPMSVRAIHSVLMPNGKVLLVAGSGNDPQRFAAGEFKSTVFDPADNSMTDIPTPVDFFCVGHVQLPDGRILVMGGTDKYPAADGSNGYLGLKNSYVFDPNTLAYTRINDMIEGKWYPSATSLGNGDVISLGGLREMGVNIESTATEYYSVAQGRWLSQAETVQTNRRWGLYPTVILMQDGRLFYSGSHTLGGYAFDDTGAEIYNYQAGTRTDVAGLQNKDMMDHSMSVLLPPAQDQRVMTFGGGNTETNLPATRQTNIIDLKQPNPVYQPGPLLPQGTMMNTGLPQNPGEGKMYLNVVILPNGKVFETSGSLYTRANDVAEASMFDPVTNTFIPGMATDPVGRNYHGSAVLLPDGRVLVVGSDPNFLEFELRMSIYSPPYLFQGPRPAIVTLPNDQWAYGTSQAITVDRPVAKAQLIRPAATTHQSDPNQRSIDLPLTGTGTTLGMNVTTNPNIAPTGWYMLTVTDSNGVPSLAKWVHVG